MSFLALLRQEAGPAATQRVVAFAAASGLLGGLSLTVLGKAAEIAPKDPASFRQFALLGLYLGGSLIAKRLALRQASESVEKTVARIQVSIAERVRRASLAALERLGEDRSFQAITNDTQMLARSAQTLVNTVSAAATLLVSLIYLASLSLQAFIAALLTFAIGTALYRWHKRGVEARIADTSSKEEQLFFLVRQVFDGFKELKLHSARRTALVEGAIAATIGEVRTLRIATQRHFDANYLMMVITFYALMAVSVFTVDWGPLPQSLAAIKVVSTLLFLLGPLCVVLNTMSFLARADAAVTSLADLDHELKGAETNVDPKVPRLRQFKELTLDGLCYRYPSSRDERGFAVGPLSLTLKPGEIVFIVGGNGSGKTSLMKLLTGLYQPSDGRIILDGVALKAPARGAYSELFATIFADFHLFDRFDGIAWTDEKRAEAQRLLHLMRLEERTSLGDACFTRTALSTGQRKRLALILTHLDDRPIHVYDEWAADQDPEFRAFFYESLLPRLRQRGRTVVAVSHDDRYFHLADRVVKLERGTFRETLKKEAWARAT